MATPEGLAAEAEALWPRWAAHLAAGAQPANTAGSEAGARLVRVLETLWQDRSEAAGAAADSLWARALGREEGGLLASVESLSALLAAFQARPRPCLELAATTHLAILCRAALLPGAGTKQRLGSRTRTWEALAQLCFRACPEALLGALGTSAALSNARSPPFRMRADPSLPHQALLLGNVLSCWHYCHTERPGLPSLLEELGWVRRWVHVLDALDQAGALAGPTAEMNEALLYICSRAVRNAGERPEQQRVLSCLLEDPRLLPWYTQELLRNIRDEIVSAAQGPRDTFRGHWVSLRNPLFHWLELRQEVAGAIAAQPKLQDWWLEALAAYSAEADAACTAGFCSLTLSPPSVLHCWRSLVDDDGVEAVGRQLTPPYMGAAMNAFGALHGDLHERLLAADAAAAQRTEAAAVAAAHCCLRLARAMDGWQGELAANERDGACWHAMAALHEYLVMLCIRPAFSCEAACRPGGMRVPGKRAVAAVIEMLQLVADVLKTVAGMPSLRQILHRFGEGVSNLPVDTCSAAAPLGWMYLVQMLPGRQLLLSSCIKGEQVQSMLSALKSLLCAQGKAMAWLQGPGRLDFVSSAGAAEGLPVYMGVTIVQAALTTVALLKPSRAEGEGQLAARWRVAMAHIALSAALGTHALPGGLSCRLEGGQLCIPAGFDLAWELKEALGSGAGSQWSSVHAWAAWVMCSSVRFAVASKDRAPKEAAQVLLTLLQGIDADGAPMAAALAALSSGMFTVLSGWVIRVTRRPSNLLKQSVVKALRRLEQVLQMACRMADALLLSLGEEARFALANERLSAHIQDALGALSQGQLQTRRQLEARGIVTAVRDAWEQRHDQLLPAMERGPRCGSAFVVAWQPAGNGASGGGAAAAAAATAPGHRCPLPPVQQAVALAGVACANPLCTRLGSDGGAGEEAAGERLQRCRGCRVAGYCCAGCGREDWERHRPACNALRHLRSGTTSVRAALGLQRG